MNGSNNAQRANPKPLPAKRNNQGKVRNLVAPNRSSTWYHTRMPGLKTQLAERIANVEAEYIYGIFHPDVVYRENLNIKAPSILPIPTTSFSFKETFFLAPNDSGNFLIIWNPNYLGSSTAIPSIFPGQLQNYAGYFSNLYYSNHASLDGNSAAQSIKAVTFRRVIQDFNKYRLTSACMKVKYTGKVLNQSGMLAACASFMEFPRSAVAVQPDAQMTSEYDIPNTFPQLQRLGDFDNIRQGQWAKTVSVVNDPDGITCVYIPTDTLSQVFVDNGDTIDAKNVVTYYPSQGTVAQTWLAKNANITYDVCGYGISKEGNISTITVECYYNYEIIVREDQMPYFRPTVYKPIASESNRDPDKAIKGIVSTAGTITKTHDHDDPSIMSRIATAIRKGFDTIEPYLPLIKVAAALV